ncbi:MAG: hypothetical protein DRP50_03535 [Thermotoga sp.]|nr:MAG: hypothetical protein DRP50_03535 [Thermotoga sp.]
MKIIHLKRAKMEVTPFGGLLLVHDFIRNIGLEAFEKDRFPAPGSNRGRCIGHYRAIRGNSRR